MIPVKNIYSALPFAAALLMAMSVGCKEKIGFGKKTTSSAPVVPVVPQVEIVVEGVPMEEQVALKSFFHLDGMMHKGNEYVVALNGQVVKTGQFLGLKVKRKNYILKVMDITSQHIVLKATEKEEKVAPSAPVSSAITSP